MNKKIKGYKSNSQAFMRKIITPVVVLALVVASFGSIMRAWAQAPSSIDNYASIQLNGNSSLEDRGNVTLINATYEHGSLTITGTGLYADGNNMIYAPVNSNVTLDINAEQEYTASLMVDGDQSNGSTVTLNSIQKKNGDAPYIVDAIFNGSQPINPQPGQNSTNSIVNYSYSGGRVEFAINNVYFDAEHATAGNGNNEETGTFDGEISYAYESGNVTLTLDPLFISRITSLVINGEDYAEKPGFPKTPEELLNSISGQTIHYSIEIPYSGNYVISTTCTENRDEYMTVGNFLWSYQEKDKDTDDYVGHGNFELVKVKYNGVEYTENQINSPDKGYLQWTQSPDEGGALFPFGAELTVKLIPDAGYQLTSFTINGGEFEAGDEVGVYTFEIPRGNFHLGAHFTAMDDEVSAESEAVESGSIVISDGEIDSGTAKLDVKDVDLTDEEIEGFEDAADGYNVSTYLDISLYQITYKGNTTDYWDEQIDELQKEATITLKLEDDVDGNEVVIVHQKHDGTYEVIPTTYDPVAHTITFKTSSFSNYAIASRTVNSPETGGFTGLEPGSMASIYGLVIAVVSVATIAVLCYNRRHDSE